MPTNRFTDSRTHGLTDYTTYNIYMVKIFSHHVRSVGDVEEEALNPK